MILPSQKPDITAPLEEVLESRRARLFALTLVLLVTFVVYSQTLLFQFVYDDLPQIVQNQQVHDWLHWSQLFRTHVWAQAFGPGSYYRPLFMLLLLAEYSVFGLHPVGWHLISVALHVGATAAVYSLARKFTRTCWALLAALLFGVHPIHVESVAWVSAVNDPLLAIFAISCVVCYIDFRHSRRHNDAWLTASVALFACALLTKETAVFLVPALSLYEGMLGEKDSHTLDRQLASRRRDFGVRLMPLLLFFAVAAAYLAIRFRVLGAFRRELTILPWEAVLYTIPRLLLHYAWRLVWPCRLSLFYDIRPSLSPDLLGFVLPCLAVTTLALVVVWGIWQHGSRTTQFFAWWIVLPLLPVLDFRPFLPGDAIHDRYLYLPSVGLAVLTALAGESAASRWGGKFVTPAGLLGGALLGLSAITTIRESLPWANNLALYLHAVEQQPHSARAHAALANELYARKLYPQAIAEYKAALQEDPNSFSSNYNLGITYKTLGKIPEAEQSFEHATLINPGRADVWISLGECYLYRSHFDSAEAAIVRGLEIDPSGIGYHAVLGDLRVMQRNLPAALHAYQEEVRLHPDQTEARAKAASVMEKLKSAASLP